MMTAVTKFTSACKLQQANHHTFKQLVSRSKLLLAHHRPVVQKSSFIASGCVVVVDWNWTRIRMLMQVVYSGGYIETGKAAGTAIIGQTAVVNAAYSLENAHIQTLRSSKILNTSLLL